MSDLYDFKGPPLFFLSLSLGPSTLIFFGCIFRLDCVFSPRLPFRAVLSRRVLDAPVRGLSGGTEVINLAVTNPVKPGSRARLAGRDRAIVGLGEKQNKRNDPLNQFTSGCPVQSTADRSVSYVLF